MVIFRCELLVYLNNFFEMLEIGYVIFLNFISVFLLGEIKVMIFEVYLFFKGFLLIVFFVKMVIKSCKGEMKNVFLFFLLRV